MKENKNIVYLHYICDHTYHIYKLSNYGRNKITLIDAGVAYRKGYYTPQFQKKIDKYNLKEYSSHTYETASSFKDFCDRLYLDSKQVGITQDGIPLPNKVFEILKEQYKFNNRD
jgi:hypothetical protein